jgi:hypothetical protein
MIPLSNETHSDGRRESEDIAFSARKYVFCSTFPLSMSQPSSQPPKGCDAPEKLSRREIERIRHNMSQPFSLYLETPHISQTYDSRFDSLVHNINQFKEVVL